MSGFTPEVLAWKKAGNSVMGIFAQLQAALLAVALALSSLQGGVYNARIIRFAGSRASSSPLSSARQTSTHL